MGFNFRTLSLCFGLFVSSLSAQTFHRVKAGESLWLIAKRAGVSVDAIREANQLKSDVIWEGADLIIPERRAIRPSVRGVLEERIPSKTAPQPLQPPVREPSPPSVSKQEEGSRRSSSISAKGLENLQLQVTLDRAGFSPGKIDGYSGNFTRLAHTLCEAWNPDALRANLPATRREQVPVSWSSYVRAGLPGTGSAPDFKALTRKKQVLFYYTALEYLAERFHCSEVLLKKLNPTVDFQNLQAGTWLVVPNVETFEIEKYLDSKGEGIWSPLIGKGKQGRRLYISAQDSMLTLWEGESLIRAYPITLNENASPRGQREVGSITPGPYYARKKTQLELKPGPNSPVGVIWCPLGDGFGIHGTSNPDSIGRSVSSGCVRLANWDAVRLGGLIRKGTDVFISQRDQKARE